MNNENTLKGKLDLFGGLFLYRTFGLLGAVLGLAFFRVGILEFVDGEFAFGAALMGLAVGTIGLAVWCCSPARRLSDLYT